MPCRRLVVRVLIARARGVVLVMSLVYGTVGVL